MEGLVISLLRGWIWMWASLGLGLGWVGRRVGNLRGVLVRYRLALGGATVS